MFREGDQARETRRRLNRIVQRCKPQRGGGGIEKIDSSSRPSQSKGDPCFAPARAEQMMIRRHRSSAPVMAQARAGRSGFSTATLMAVGDALHGGMRWLRGVKLR